MEGREVVGNGRGRRVEFVEGQGRGERQGVRSEEEEEEEETERQNKETQQRTIMSLANLFGRGKTPAEQLKANQRSLQKAMRDLDRERNKMEQQEKKLILDIKKAAKAGQMVCASCYIHHTSERRREWRREK